MGFDYNAFASNRREYGKQSLNKADTADSPLEQFEHWFADALAEKIPDPTAMVLSTVDARGCPNSRVVLLKGLEDGAFVFYTNYESTKSIELESVPYAALNFYWSSMARQVRIRGSVKRVSEAASAAYFESRSVMSQCSAVVSPQSREIASRAELVEKASQLKSIHQKNKNKNKITCPDYWGGFAVYPEEIEFWQGRDHRLHDRILYTQKKSKWIKSRLAS
ncbi:MAG: pyridoxamine 5'-phosphate oxidase [Legionella sp.]|nr:pyridoxamine 5'-phosphate oxidase [Legionella sp.]